MQKDIFRIGSFNLLNLVLPETKYYGKREYSKEDYSKKMNWIANQLSRMDADIVGFQEVFHEEALQEIVRNHPLYTDANIVVAEPSGQHPTVGVVSRYPINSVEVFKDFPEQLEVEGMTIPFKSFSRPVLKVDIQVTEEHHIVVFVAHLKSKRPMIPDDVKNRDHPLEISKGQARSLLLRAAEANALRTILMDSLENRDCPVVVLGDLNDNNTAVTTQLISGDAPRRYYPMNVKRKLWDILLYHVKDIQARQSSRDVYYTHIHNGHYESLDHIMVSQELVKENPDRIGRVVFVRAFNDHLIDETLSPDRVDCWKSDHAQVVATIELAEPKHKHAKK
ncbi:MAG: endonuclease/exonuclease/phosphatase family protein [Aureispira sp.]|nr:endonuclease/exonuclease/phosphatase family protein [Aureispira sp.]